MVDLHVNYSEFASALMCSKSQMTKKFHKTQNKSSDIHRIKVKHCNIPDSDSCL